MVIRRYLWFHWVPVESILPNGLPYPLMWHLMLYVRGGVPGQGFSPYTHANCPRPLVPKDLRLTWISGAYQGLEHPLDDGIVHGEQVIGFTHGALREGDVTLPDDNRVV